MLGVAVVVQKGEVVEDEMETARRSVELRGEMEGVAVASASSSAVVADRAAPPPLYHLAADRPLTFQGNALRARRGTDCRGYIGAASCDRDCCGRADHRRRRLPLLPWRRWHAVAANRQMRRRSVAHVSPYRALEEIRASGNTAQWYSRAGHRIYHSSYLAVSSCAQSSDTRGKACAAWRAAAARAAAHVEPP